MKKIFLATLSALAVAGAVIAAPSERPSSDLTRTKTASDGLNAKLSKNIYRTEEYEANYTVSVPYEADETYYVSVPYQDTEDYWENVPYQTSEQVCTDNVSYRQECRTERVCNNIIDVSAKLLALMPDGPGGPGGPGRGGPGGGPGRGPGGPGGPGGGGWGGGHGPGGPGGPGGGGHGPGGPGGGPGHGGGGGWGGGPGHGGGGNPPPPPRPVCHNEQRCTQVPVHNRECHMQSVTRYRQERRTRTVTKYRDEARTRTVTRYRDEERCCVTKTRSVYDHQIAADVTFVFPAEATLEANEKESFRAVLESDGDLKVKALKSIYSYSPLVSDLGGGKYSVEMKLVPTYAEDQLGLKTVGNLRLTVVGARSRLTFEDLGAVNKTKTVYDLQLVDAATGAVLIQELKENLANSQRITWDLNATTVAGKIVAVRLNVARDGIVVAAPVRFELQASLTVKKEASYDPSPYTKSSRIHHFRIAGKNDAIVVSFRDNTKVIDEVSTEYRLGIFVQEGKTGRLLVEKTFNRAQVKVEKDGDILFSLANDFGLAAEELANLNPGKVIALSGEVLRYGSRFKEGKAVVAAKAKLTVPKK
ncbi:MAG: hypothetical protein AB7K68_00080 [Bacteriovoracia bacterium]